MILLLATVLGFFSALQSFYIYKTGEGYCPGTHEETIIPGPISPGNSDAVSLPIIEAEKETSSCAYLYSRLEASIAGLHFSELAPIYFSVLLVITVVYYFSWHKYIRVILGTLYTIGLVIVPYLVYIEVKLTVICFCCTIMHVVIIFSSMLFYYGSKEKYCRVLRMVLEEKFMNILAGTRY